MKHYRKDKYKEHLKALNRYRERNIILEDEIEVYWK